MTRARRPPSMLRGLVLFGDDFAYVRLVAVVAPAGHSCPALATKLFIPSAIGMVFAGPTLRRKQMGQFLAMPNVRSALVTFQPLNACDFPSRKMPEGGNP